MINNELKQEFKQLREMIFQVNQKLSVFNDLRYEQTDEIIHQNQTDIEDAAIENDIQTNKRLIQIEDAIIELERKITEGVTND